MKLAFVIESIVEQDILDKLADILCDRIELMKDKFFEIYQRQEFDHVWKVNVQYKKEMNIPNFGISIGKLCGKGVLGKYYNKLGHVKLDVWFLDKKPEFHNGAYDMYTNTVSINCFVKIIDGIAVIDMPFIKSVLVHEMRHALEYRLYGKKAFNQVTRQTLSKYSDYLGTREEVSARISQVMLGIRNLIETGQVNKDNLNSKILEMMDRYKLHHIFDTQNYFAQGEEMELFGRKMMRSNILFAPHDNKQFRKLFNKIYVYAIHCLERIQKNEIVRICENQQNERLSHVIKTICNLIDDIRNDAEYFFITERFTHIKYYILNGNMSYMNVKKRIPKLYILQLSRPYITHGIGIEYVKKVVDFFDRQINEIGITGHSIISTDNEKDFQIDFSYIEPHIEKIISKKDVYIGRDGRIDKDLSFLNSNNDAITNYMKQILSHGYNNKICTFDITFNTLREEVVKSVMVINVIRRTGIAKEQLDMLSLPDFFNYSTDENANFSQFIDAFCKGVSKMFSVDNDVKYELKDSSIFINFVFKPRNPILRDITINGIEI